MKLARRKALIFSNRAKAMIKNIKWICDKLSLTFLNILFKNRFI